MALPHDIDRIISIGIGATFVLDVWLVLLRRVGIPTQDFALIGRWLGHALHGTYAHAAIARTQPIRGERAAGWLAHYVIGIAFAGALVAIQGESWARLPTLAPAVGFGLVTVVLPLFVMQPAMGAGFASSKTPTPVRNCLRSLGNHAIFGFGLYLSALVVAQWFR